MLSWIQKLECVVWLCLIFTLDFTFFFFQAEDGIRDGRVTGVQTCALPISLYQAAKVENVLISPGFFFRSETEESGPADAWMRVNVSRCEGTVLTQVLHLRSEERRVGKSVDLGGRRIIKRKITKLRQMR